MLIDKSAKSILSGNVLSTAKRPNEVFKRQKSNSRRDLMGKTTGCTVIPTILHVSYKVIAIGLVDVLSNKGKAAMASRNLASQLRLRSNR